MFDHLNERSLDLSIHPASADLLADVEQATMHQIGPEEVPIRFAVTESQSGQWSCDVGVQVGTNASESIFRFVKRGHERTDDFNVVMLVPTGIGAEIGGHAGDAMPAAALLASVCDSLITHPNVYNASDMIQIPRNGLYVEGSVITRLMMGTARLASAKSNRVLVLAQSHDDRMFTDAAVNAVNAARAYYGLRVPEVVMIDPSFRMVSEYSPSGTATGRVEGMEHIWRALDSRLGEFDAVAITSVIEVPAQFHWEYYESQGGMINPWGGVEAMLTHAISLKYGIPAAHSPMFESRQIAELDLGVVDPRMAAEVVSVTFFQSVLRGLQTSPGIVNCDSGKEGTIGAEDISCIVIPAGCLGLPTLAAIGQGIPVITVRENSNIMRNNLASLPWAPGQLIETENYWEAAGVLSALRIGLDPCSMRRPISGVPIAHEDGKSRQATGGTQLMHQV